MKIGVPKEIKPQENRIGLTPESVKVLTSNGNEVLVEKNGGIEAGFDNEQYKKAFSKRETIKVAQNKIYISKSTKIKNDDEIAFFPPVTGG